MKWNCQTNSRNHRFAISNTGTYRIYQQCRSRSDCKKKTCSLILTYTVGQKASEPLSTTYPFPKPQLLDSSKLKEFADDNFKFNENGRKVTKWVENTMGKGEIGRYEQFLLFPQCFKRLVL